MKKKLILNTITALLFQITSLICGFILPRLILSNFGSEVNGLVSSITQFLNLIAFLEMGIGAVIMSSLYKPLAQKDNKQISMVLKSGDNFFKKLAFVFFIYIIFLTIFYPLVVEKNFDWLYTALLILAMSISSLAQYYFGIIDRLLLTADQRGYIQYIAQIITLILNTVGCAIIIKLGGTIQLVKLMTSIIFLARPICLRLYINKRYHINRKIKLDCEPIPQKWNGIAQHISAVVLDNTDIIVLTLLSTLTNVSIYSVYFMIVSGVKNILLTGSSGIQSVMGEYQAKGEKEKLQNFFEWVEFIIHTVAVLLFSVTAVLIVPFVEVYTRDIKDVNYIQPLFAFILVSAHAVHCLRLPYNLMILSGGHYKQTQRCYIIGMIINIIISILTVHFFGLIGVAIGTLVAMIYQTIWMAIYNSKNFIKWPIRLFCKQVAIDILTVFIIVLSTKSIKLNGVTYLSWIIMALKVCSIGILISVIINLIFYRKKIVITYQKTLLRFRKKIRNG